MGDKSTPVTWAEGNSSATVQYPSLEPQSMHLFLAASNKTNKGRTTHSQLPRCQSPSRHPGRAGGFLAWCDTDCRPATVGTHDAKDLDAPVRVHHWGEPVFLFISTPCINLTQYQLYRGVVEGSKSYIRPGAVCMIRATVLINIVIDRGR